MARNNMEKEFSDKLNQREIQPSGAAWDRLDAMLTATEAKTEAKKQKRNFKWLYIAASFAGFLLLTTLIFRQGKTDAVDKQIVNQENTAVAPKVEVPAQVIELPKQADSQIAESSVEPKEVDRSKPASIRSNQKITANPQIKQQLASNTINQNQSNSPEVSNINQKSPSENASQMSLTNNADELLAAAQARREANQARIKVSAKSLLSQVDTESEEKLTSRQKALRALNRNYQQVKVAVSTRNLEENH